MTVGNLDDLRSAVVRRIESLPGFSGVPVVPEDRQNLKSEIDKALGQSGGLVVTVGTGSAKGAAANDPLPQSDVEVIVECCEIPAINRGPAGRQIPAITLANAVIAALHHHAWERGKALVYDEMVYDKNDKSALVIYALVFRTRIAHEAALGV